MIQSAQIRAARALLDWTARELAERSGVSLATIQRLERQSGIPVSHPRTLADLKRAFEEAGVEFIGTPEEPGVILRRR
jgi:transcriptional regulator with XRE-family HTH domain